MNSNKLVDFIIPGVQKSGTTALKAYLAQSDSICFTHKKESHYFKNDSDQDYQKEGLTKLYKNAKNSMLWGDKSPSYIYHENILGKIKIHNPQIKIIVLLRNPILRAYSGYHMMIRHQMIERNITFAMQIKSEMSEFEKEKRPKKKLINRGFYPNQLNDIFSLFSVDQIKVLKFENFEEYPQVIINEITNFLNIPKFNITKLNLPKRIYPKIENDIINLLLPIYKKKNEDLSNFVSFDFDDWFNNKNI